MRRLPAVVSAATVAEVKLALVIAQLAAARKAVRS